MSDLISRSELIETLEQDIKMTERFMERTATTCKEYSCLNAQLNTLKSCKSIVEDKPCAYDVEKVVSELRLKSDYESIDSDYGGYIIETDNAIEIVRNGGKE